MNNNDQQVNEEKIKAAVFDRLVAHLQENTDVQNIDLMILADFCRNCLSKWYSKAAEDSGIEVDYEEARTLIYGMPYPEWKEKFQLPATNEQQQAMSARNKEK